MGVAVGTAVGGGVGVTVGTTVGFGTVVGLAGTLVAVGIASGFAVGFTSGAEAFSLGAGAFSGADYSSGFEVGVGAVSCCVADSAAPASINDFLSSSEPEEQPTIKAEAKITNIDPGIRIFFKPVFISASKL